jgi:hypothetical protein
MLIGLTGAFSYMYMEYLCYWMRDEEIPTAYQFLHKIKGTWESHMK